MSKQAQYPYREGDYITLGPQIFAAADRSVINWKGENYVPQRPSLRVRFHNWRVRRRARGEG